MKLFKNKVQAIKFVLLWSLTFYLLAFIYIVNTIETTNQLPLI